MNDQSREPYLKEAEDDLNWWFSSSGAAIGFGAQSYEGGGGRVFDEAASNRVHSHYHGSRHSRQVAEMSRIDRTLRRIDGGTFLALRLAFEPRHWSSGSPQLLAATEGPGALLEQRLTRARVSHVGLAIVCERAWSAYARRTQRGSGGAPVELLRFLEDEAGKGNDGLFRAILDEAGEIKAAALAAYQEQREAVIWEIEGEERRKKAIRREKAEATMAGAPVLRGR